MAKPLAIAVQRGDSAVVVLPAGRLGCHLGLGLDPPEAYLPPRESFDAQAPAFARGHYDSIERAFRAAGFRFVVASKAAIWEASDGVADLR